MLRTLLILLCLGCSLTSYAELPGPDDLFQKGLAAYQNKDYAQARDNFHKLMAEDQANLGVLHNLALTEYQLQQRAMAIALWRKALSLDPGFTLARQGRDYLERKYNIQGWERTSVQRSLRRFLESVSMTESLLLLAILLGVAGWFWIRYLSLRKIALEDETAMPVFPWIAVAFTVTAAATVALISAQVKFASPIRATIVMASSPLRSLPAEDGVSLLELTGGSEVLIRRQQKEWSQVQSSEGSTGWVKNSDILVTSGWTKL